MEVSRRVFLGGSIATVIIAARKPPKRRISAIDNGDGTITWSGTDVIDNGDGTYTLNGVTANASGVFTV